MVKASDYRDANDVQIMVQSEMLKTMEMGRGDKSV